MLITSSRRMAGFSLVEMMLALSVGLIVSFAVVSFLASLLQTNAATIQSTRLTQELRTVAEIVSREIRRARAMTDPISNIGQGADDPATVGVIEGAQNPFGTFTVVDNDCVLFGYEGAEGGAYRAIRHAATDGVGSIVLARNAAAVDCDSAGTTINSPAVNITALELELVGSDRIDVRVAGYLAGDPDATTREFRTSVFLRSSGI